MDDHLVDQVGVVRERARDLLEDGLLTHEQLASLFDALSDLEYVLALRIEAGQRRCA